MIFFTTAGLVKSPDATYTWSKYDVIVNYNHCHEYTQTLMSRYHRTSLQGSDDTTTNTSIMRYLFIYFK